jgi:type I restriction enzyme S subunit
MNAKQAKYPKLRFKGFTAPWEQRKLGQGMAEYTDRIYIDDTQTYKQISVRNTGSIGLRGEQFGSKIGRKRQAKINLDKYPVTLIFTRQAIEQGGIGFAPQETNHAIVTENMPTISVNTRVYNVYYLTALFLTESYYKYAILDNIQGGSAQVAIHEDDWLQSEFNQPDLNEQTKIGTFFKSLDNLITVNQRKLAKLKELKQGYLQKMFPKNGSKFPQLRFSGFADAWEQRKLGEETTISAGGDIDKEKIFDNGKYPVYANALTNNGIVGYYEDTYRIEAPAVTVTGRGDVGHAQARKVNFTPVVRLLAVKSKHDVDFLENAINNHAVLIESTGVPQLTSPQLGNYKIYFPSFEEQQKIGVFFRQLDDTITLHQRKLEKLQELKKGYLQKMFC